MAHHQHLRTVALAVACALMPALVPSLSPGASAQQAPSLPARLSPAVEALETQPMAGPKESVPEHWRKVSSSLRGLIARAALDGTDLVARDRDLSTYSDRLVEVRADGAAAVTVRVEQLGAGERAVLDRLGYEITFASEEFRFLEGWLPLSRVEEVAMLEFVLAVGPTPRPETNSGRFNSEGDRILFADEARRRFGVSGRGVKVGVISDSVDGIDTARASGDLPASGVQVLSFGQGSGEGTAMLEIVHDLAPEASLAFYGPGSAGDMVAGITALANAGCDVIVDDLTYLLEPTFEDGAIARTVASVVARGVVYVTAAGNFGEECHQSDFRSAGPIQGVAENAHNFGGSPFQQFTVPGRTQARVFLQWANLFGSSADDYDLYILNGAGQMVARSIDEQSGRQDPVETVIFENTSSSAQDFFAVVDLYSGSPRRLRLLYPDASFVRFATQASSIVGHQTSSSAISVATINADTPGNATIASYSSRGPSDIYFPSFEQRPKPDITGIDGVAVTGAAGFSNPFFGTSAAAPHIAAIAALVLQANPLLTPAEVRYTLQFTSADLGASGFDFVYGSGRANALFAVNGVPILLAAGIVGNKFVCEGNGFDPGATIFINGVPQRTKNDRLDPVRRLVSKKAARLVVPGRPFTLEVRNPDGTSSGVFTITR
jgi:subtilisin family serine protease